MKILIFEYITGGGLCREDLPDSLAAEGLLMLKALLRDLSALEEVKPLLLLDSRLTEQVAGVLDECVSLVQIGRADDVFAVLAQHIAGCDAAWPVAPEIDSILFDLTRLLEKHRKPVLSSPSGVVALTSDKFKTYQHLTAHDIGAVPTELLQRVNFKKAGKQVLKPIDGMGCERTFIIDANVDLEDFIQRLDAPERYIVQPFVEGQPKSLSCLFRNGKGWLLSANSQDVRIREQRFELTACQVNHAEKSDKYQHLVDRVAQALPDLWGYAGIDFIETDEGMLVLEINPRLTTSYAGIFPALGINVAEQALTMLTQDPVLRPANNQSIIVSIERGILNAN